MNLHYETPLVESELISQVAGCRVYLKLENVQNGGSFKIRGIGYHCTKEQGRGCERLISSSGGNAGIATAYAGRKLGMSVTVIVPQSTPNITRNRIEKEGAAVIVHGKTWNEANEYSLSLATEPGNAHIHPFDHPNIWNGHSSLVTELNSQLQGTKPDALVLSVGGGGLLNGVVQGLQSSGWGDVPVIAVETNGADSFAAACKAGKLVTLPDITSVAKCLGAKTVSQRSLDLIKEHPIYSTVVPDKAAVDSCYKLLDDHRLLVEPACGAALAVVYNPHILDDLQQQGKLPTPLRTVVVIVCGGNCVDIELLSKWKKELSKQDELKMV